MWNQKITRWVSVIQFKQVEAIDIIAQRIRRGQNPMNSVNQLEVKPKG
jgi:hypothetical protein